MATCIIINNVIFLHCNIVNFKVETRSKVLTQMTSWSIDIDPLTQKMTWIINFGL